jgi:hypothetical protein
MKTADELEFPYGARGQTLRVRKTSPKGQTELLVVIQA